MPHDAIEWLQKSIAGGHTPAMTYLGGYYLREGRYDKAIPLLEKAAAAEEEGCAKYSLASMYLEGKAVPRDMAKVESLFLASRGCANVGPDAHELYTDGKIVSKDYALALRILSNEDFGPYKIRIARLYETGGPGLKQDRKKALEIFLWADEMGYGVKDDLKRMRRHDKKP
jgi:TPR repeat protein